jgi:hypothetical protein
MQFRRPGTRRPDGRHLVEGRTRSPGRTESTPFAPALNIERDRRTGSSPGWRSERDVPDLPGLPAGPARLRRAAAPPRPSPRLPRAPARVGWPGLTNGSATSNISSSGTIVSATPPGGVNHAYRARRRCLCAGRLQGAQQSDAEPRAALGVRRTGFRQPRAAHQRLAQPDQHGQYAGISGGYAGHHARHRNSGRIRGSFQLQLCGFPDASGGRTIPEQSENRHAEQPVHQELCPARGLAWKPLRPTSSWCAAGGGYFYDRVGVTTYNKSTQTSIPYAVPYQQSGAANYFSSFSQPYAPAALGWTPRWANATTTSNLNVVLTAPVYPTPLTYEWNLNAQYEFLLRDGCWNWATWEAAAFIRRPTIRSTRCLSIRSTSPCSRARRLPSTAS